MVAWMMGWGDAAFPDHSGGFFWVYILAPCIGGAIAAILEPLMKRITTKEGTTI
jgi:glycerol uptake facilitator protein